MRWTAKAPNRAPIGALRRCPSAWRRRVLRLVRAEGRLAREGGSSLIEFLGSAMVFIVPLVYFVLTLAQVQNAVFAVSVIAADAARISAQVSEPNRASERVRWATTTTLAGYGLNQSASDVVAIHCAAACHTPGGEVRATATVYVNLPLVPSTWSEALNLRVPATASRSYFVGPYSD
ncbi:pilus assembly protein [Micrococcales bacterium 31B]|nr:pilus assembly protein [Micrococcales bacterium 31B]